ncbi:MAG: alpha/beta hydrolase-fold protein [Rhodococcus sp. (in: high G+C Gram-positive bacteria)]
MNRTDRGPHIAGVSARPRGRVGRASLVGAVTAGVALSLCVTPAGATTNAAAPQQVTDLARSGLPADIPQAALQPEPDLPEPESWAFSEAFPRTSGTARYDAGAYLWTDWLYDDMGAGDFSYASPDAAGNGSDVFRAGIAADDASTYWRIDWNTLVSADVPVAAWAFDTDSDPATGSSAWPADAGVSSPGIDQVMIVSSRGIWLIDAATGDRSDLTAVGAELSIDDDARSFIVAVPKSALAADGTWSVRLATGVANETGEGFAAAPGQDDETRIYNAAFRDREDEPFLVGGWTNSSTRWNNGRQSDALGANDITDFFIELDWSRISAGETTADPAPTGYSTRWYVSTLDLGQGLDPQARSGYGPALRGPSFYGRVQPYTVYVPTTYDSAVPAPLTMLLHSGDRNHNGFGGPTQEDVYGPMCEERGSICVTPLARGNTTWYINEGELDVWEVWGVLADTYSLDPDRTVVGGWSMGAVGATRLAANHPDLFAAAVIVSGAGYYDTQGRRDQAGDELRMENLMGLVTFMDSGTRDVAQTATRRWDAAADVAEVRYRANYYENATHGELGESLGWDDAAEYVQTHPQREPAPSNIAFRWEPGDARPDLGITVDRAYWLTDLDPRDETARWSRVTGESHALKTTEYDAVLSDDIQIIDGRNVQVRDQRWVEAGSVEPRNEISTSAENVAAMAIDLDRAGLDASAPATVTILADGATDVTLKREDSTAATALVAGEHVLSSPQAPGTISAVAADGAARVTWAASASSLPLYGYVVRDASGAVVCEAVSTSCRVEGLINGTAYSFSVTASNILGTSESTASAWVTPSPRPADPGVSLAVSAKSQCVNGAPVIAVHVLNKEAIAADVRITTVAGEVKVTKLQPGAAVYRTFAVAETSVDHGLAAIAGYTWNGSGQYTVYQAGYAAAACG